MLIYGDTKVLFVLKYLKKIELVFFIDLTEIERSAK